jgi:hypothetical protein
MQKSNSNTLVSFLALGVSIALFIGAILLLSWLFLVGAIIGGILYVALLIKQKFFPSPQPPKPQKPSGKTYEHDDFIEKK